jgi:hypothetical protein
LRNKSRRKEIFNESRRIDTNAITIYDHRFKEGVDPPLNPPLGNSCWTLSSQHFRVKLIKYRSQQQVPQQVPSRLTMIDCNLDTQADQVPESSTDNLDILPEHVLNGHVNFRSYSNALRCWDLLAAMQENLLECRFCAIVLRISYLPMSHFWRDVPYKEHTHWALTLMTPVDVLAIL